MTKDYYNNETEELILAEDYEMSLVEDEIESLEDKELIHEDLTTVDIRGTEESYEMFASKFGLDGY